MGHQKVRSEINKVKNIRRKYRFREIMPSRKQKLEKYYQRGKRAKN